MERLGQWETGAGGDWDNGRLGRVKKNYKKVVPGPLSRGGPNKKMTGNFIFKHLVLYFFSVPENSIN